MMKPEELQSAAQQHFGITTDFREVGFITPDGRMLDFSGKNEGGSPGERSYDHRDIQKVGDVTLVEALQLGLIRVYPEAGNLELSVEPTSEQYKTIGEFVEFFDGDVQTDLIKFKEREDVGYQKYTSETEHHEYNRANPSKVIADLKAFFAPKEFKSARSILGRGGEEDPWEMGKSVYANPKENAMKTKSEERFSEWLPDAFTEKHFKRWLKDHVHEDDRAEVESEIRKYVEEDPEVLDHCSWPEILALAEGEPISKNPDEEDYVVSNPEDEDEELQNPEGLDDFTESYLEAALWSSTDDEGEPFDNNFSISDFAPKAIERAKGICERFQQDNEKILESYYQELPDHEWTKEEQAGHDLWLTQGHHGVGFWDRGVSKRIGDALTKAAHATGELDVVQGDDGALYLE